MTAFEYFLLGAAVLIYLRIWRVCDYLADIKKLLEKRNG